MHKRINILNCPVDVLTMKETLEIIDNSITSRIPVQHVVVNAAKIVTMQKDKELAQAIANNDIINADGQAVIWASRILKKPLEERVTGIDLMQNLVQLSHERGYKIFLLGAKEEIVQKIASQYRQQYGDHIIAGYRNGYFDSNEEEEVIKQISKSNADILFVAISSPKKELFLNRYNKALNVPFIMGVGGSFDVISGKVTRAPLWMQRYGLEWFYRLIQEPRRMWRRYFYTNTLFIWLVLKAKLSRK